MGVLMSQSFNDLFVVHGSRDNDFIFGLVIVSFGTVHEDAVRFHFLEFDGDLTDLLNAFNQ